MSSRGSSQEGGWSQRRRCEDSCRGSSDDGPGAKKFGKLLEVGRGMEMDSSLRTSRRNTPLMIHSGLVTSKP